MAQAEVVTVRMSRGNVETPWGFDIVPPTQISNVVGGSLADRAGLLNGDTLVQLEGFEKPDFPFAKQLLAKAEHKIELIVHRDANHTARLWKPSITENAEFSRFQHSVHSVGDTEPRGIPKPPPPPPPPPSTNVPFKVSLEHQQQSGVNVPGFNVKAQPYGQRQEVKHLQYNSPMPLYSPQTAAEQYLQQTGGLFGTDPHVAKMNEVPAYLRSETLRLIQEDEARREMPHPISVQRPAPKEAARVEPPQNVAAGPQCYMCGRSIQGVLCRAFDHTLHPECFRCATCGSSLKNSGHHFVNGKFYCAIHGHQVENRTHLTAPYLHPDLAVRSSPTAVSPRRTQENVRAFYQPEIMARRPLSISPTPWKTQSPISPNTRGIPSSAVQYGLDLRNETFTTPAITTSSLERRSEYRTSSGVNPTAGSERLLGLAQASSGREVQTPSDKIVNALQNLEIRQSSANNNAFSSRQTQERRTFQTEDTMRGRGTLQAQGSRIPYCEHCRNPIRGAYILANGLAYCPDHFVCANKACNRQLLEIGFVEDKGQKYCEQCFETLIAPHCAKCGRSIIADCLNALQKQWHPECFVCTHCQKPFGNSAFFLEQGQPYCEEDWNALFTTRCIACSYPIEAGDRWVEALGAAFHSNCFNCTHCNVNLEGESFYAKNGAPYCKLHA